jgi:hypothetical protein
MTPIDFRVIRAKDRVIMIFTLKVVVSGALKTATVYI